MIFLKSFIWEQNMIFLYIVFIYSKSLEWLHDCYALIINHSLRILEWWWIHLWRLPARFQHWGSEKPTSQLIEDASPREYSRDYPRHHSNDTWRTVVSIVGVRVVGEFLVLFIKTRRMKRREVFNNSIYSI